MTITGGSALSKDDIDKMVKDAEQYADEDKAHLLWPSRSGTHEALFQHRQTLSAVAERPKSTISLRPFPAAGEKLR